MGKYCESCGDKMYGMGVLYKECFSCWDAHRSSHGMMESDKDDYVIVINGTKREYNLLTYEIEELETLLRKAGKGDTFKIRGLGTLECTQLSWVWKKNVYSKKFYCNLKESV